MLITEPRENADTTAVFGVDAHTMPNKVLVVSNVSCSTSCLAVVLDVLERAVDVEAAMVSTVRAYTADQSLVDMPQWRQAWLAQARESGIEPLPRFARRLALTGPDAPAGAYLPARMHS